MHEFDRTLPQFRRLTFFVAVLLYLLFSLTANLSAQNGISANESTTGISGSSGVDALWADGNDHRWKANNNGLTNSYDIGLWPCTTQTGGIVYSGSVPTGGGVNLEACLSLPSPAVAGVPLLVGSSAPQWGAENLDIQGYALVVEVATNATAPSANKLVIFTGAPTTVTVAGTSTNGIEGICAGNCSATNAQIAREGIVGCVFDNTTTAGHYVQATGSSSQCHDAGASYPTNGNQVLGRVLVTNTTSGQTNNIMLYPPGLPSQLALSGTGSDYQTTNATTSTSGDIVTYDGHANTQDSGTLLSSLASLGSPALTGTPTAPTATAGTNTTQVATTAFVQNAVTNVLTTPTTTVGLSGVWAHNGTSPGFIASTGGQAPT